MKKIINQKLIILILILVYFSSNSNAQTIVKGKVFDSKTKTTLPFAHIAVEKYPIGTCTSEDGYFEITLQDSILPCNLHISSITHKPFVLNITKKGVLNKNIYLTENEYSIDEVTVKGSKISSKRLLKSAMKNIPKYFYNKQHTTLRRLKVSHYNGSKVVYKADYTVSVNEPAYNKKRYSMYDNLVEKISVIKQNISNKDNFKPDLSLKRFVNVFDEPYDILRINPARYANWSTKTYRTHKYQFLADSIIYNEFCYVVESSRKDSLINDIKYINKDIFYINQNNNALVAYKEISYIESPRTRSLDELSLNFTKKDGKYILKDIRFDGYIRDKDNEKKPKKITTHLTFILQKSKT